MQPGGKSKWTLHERLKGRRWADVMSDDDSSFSFAFTRPKITDESTSNSNRNTGTIGGAIRLRIQDIDNKGLSSFLRLQSSSTSSASAATAQTPVDLKNEKILGNVSGADVLQTAANCASSSTATKDVNVVVTCPKVSVEKGTKSKKGNRKESEIKSFPFRKRQTSHSIEEENNRNKNAGGMCPGRSGATNRRIEDNWRAPQLPKEVNNGERGETAIAKESHRQDATSNDECHGMADGEATKTPPKSHRFPNGFSGVMSQILAADGPPRRNNSSTKFQSKIHRHGGYDKYARGDTERKLQDLTPTRNALHPIKIHMSKKGSALSCSNSPNVQVKQQSPFIQSTLPHVLGSTCNSGESAKMQRLPSVRSTNGSSAFLRLPSPETYDDSSTNDYLGSRSTSTRSKHSTTLSRTAGGKVLALPTLRFSNSDHLSEFPQQVTPTTTDAFQQRQKLLQLQPEFLCSERKHLLPSVIKVKPPLSPREPIVGSPPPNMPNCSEVADTPTTPSVIFETSTSSTSAATHIQPPCLIKKRKNSLRLFSAVESLNSSTESQQHQTINALENSSANSAGPQEGSVNVIPEDDIKESCNPNPPHPHTTGFGGDNQNCSDVATRDIEKRPTEATTASSNKFCVVQLINEPSSSTSTPMESLQTPACNPTLVPLSTGGQTSSVNDLLVAVVSALPPQLKQLASSMGVVIFAPVVNSNVTPSDTSSLLNSMSSASLLAPNTAATDNQTDVRQQQQQPDVNDAKYVFESSHPQVDVSDIVGDVQRQSGVKFYRGVAPPSCEALRSLTFGDICTMRDEDKPDSDMRATAVAKSILPIVNISRPDDTDSDEKMIMRFNFGKETKEEDKWNRTAVHPATAREEIPPNHSAPYSSKPSIPPPTQSQLLYCPPLQTGGGFHPPYAHENAFYQARAVDAVNPFFNGQSISNFSHPAGGDISLSGIAANETPFLPGPPSRVQGGDVCQVSANYHMMGYGPQMPIISGTAPRPCVQSFGVAESPAKYAKTSDKRNYYPPHNFSKDDQHESYHMHAKFASGHNVGRESNRRDERSGTGTTAATTLTTVIYNAAPNTVNPCNDNRSVSNNSQIAPETSSNEPLRVDKESRYKQTDLALTTINTVSKASGPEAANTYGRNESTGKAPEGAVAATGFQCTSIIHCTESGTAEGIEGSEMVKNGKTELLEYTFPSLNAASQIAVTPSKKPNGKVSFKRRNAIKEEAPLKGNGATAEVDSKAPHDAAVSKELLQKETSDACVTSRPRGRKKRKRQNFIGANNRASNKDVLAFGLVLPRDLEVPKLPQPQHETPSKPALKLSPANCRSEKIQELALFQQPSEEYTVSQTGLPRRSNSPLNYHQYRQKRKEGCSQNQKNLRLQQLRVGRKQNPQNSNFSLPCAPLYQSFSEVPPEPQNYQNNYAPPKGIPLATRAKPHSASCPPPAPPPTTTLRVPTDPHLPSDVNCTFPQGQPNMPTFDPNSNSSYLHLHSLQQPPQNPNDLSAFFPFLSSFPPYTQLNHQQLPFNCSTISPSNITPYCGTFYTNGHSHFFSSRCDHFEDVSRIPYNNFGCYNNQVYKPQSHFNYHPYPYQSELPISRHQIPNFYSFRNSLEYRETAGEQKKAENGTRGGGKRKKKTRGAHCGNAPIAAKSAERSTTNISASRMRQIDIAKASSNYQMYITSAPKNRRRCGIEPVTPSASSAASHRDFMDSIMSWRRQIHNYIGGRSLSKSPFAEEASMMPIAQKLSSGMPCGLAAELSAVTQVCTADTKASYSSGHSSSSRALQDCGLPNDDEPRHEVTVGKASRSMAEGEGANTGEEEYFAEGVDGVLEIFNEGSQTTEVRNRVELLTDTFDLSNDSNHEEENKCSINQSVKANFKSVKKLEKPKFVGVNLQTSPESRTPNAHLQNSPSVVGDNQKADQSTSLSISRNSTQGVASSPEQLIFQFALEIGEGILARQHVYE